MKNIYVFVTRSCSYTGKARAIPDILTAFPLQDLELRTLILNQRKTQTHTLLTAHAFGVVVRKLRHPIHSHGCTKQPRRRFLTFHLSRGL